MSGFTVTVMALIMAAIQSLVFLPVIYVGVRFAIRHELSGRLR
jgi:hypothetical protein